MKTARGTTSEDQLLLPDDACWNVLDPPPDKRGNALFGIEMRGSTETRADLENLLLDFCTLDWMSMSTLAELTDVHLRWVLDETISGLMRRGLIERQWHPSIDDESSHWEYRTVERERRRRIRKEGIRPHDVEL